MSLIDSARFLGALFSPYRGRDALTGEIRCLPPQRRGSCGPILWFDFNPESTERAILAAAEQAPKWDVTFGVLPRTGGKGKRENIVSAAWLWADVDPGGEGYRGAVQRVLDSAAPRPHIAVKSGGGLHLYWRLETSVPLLDPQARETFETTLRRLARAIGGEAPAAHTDLAACKSNFLLRIPGTINHKHDRPVKLLHFALDTPRRSYDWWRINLPPEPAKAPPPRFFHASTPMEPPDRVPRWILDMLQFATPQGQRHVCATKLTYGAFRAGYTRAAVETFADQFCSLNQFERSEMLRLLDSAERKVG